jgi:hypothetical protein
MAASSSSDQAKKTLAESIAKARNQYLVAGQVIDQVMTRVKKELADNMLILGPDGKPVLSEQGVPMVPDSKIVQFVEFKKGLIQVDLVMAAANKMKTLTESGDAASSSSSASATAEVSRLASEIESVQAEAMMSMAEAMRIFQQACFGGPLSEAEYQELKAKMEKAGQDSITRMLSMITVPETLPSTLPSSDGSPAGPAAP